MYRQEKCALNPPERKRGRPSGKNRAPLSLEERRARNAQYERERRNETAEAMLQLAEAVGCPPTESNEQILRNAVVMLGRHVEEERESNTDLDVMRRINDCLSAQIAKLEKDLCEMRELRPESNEGPQKRKMLEEPACSTSQDPGRRKQKKLKRESGLSTTDCYTPPPETVQPISCPLPVEPIAVVPQLEASYVPSAEEAWQFQSEFSWSLPDPMTETLMPLDQQRTSESGSECSSPVELGDILDSLSDEEKTLIWGVVQQIDTNAAVP